MRYPCILLTAVGVPALLSPVSAHATVLPLPPIEVCSFQGEVTRGPVKVSWSLNPQIKLYVDAAASALPYSSGVGKCEWYEGDTIEVADYGFGYGQGQKLEGVFEARDAYADQYTFQGTPTPVEEYGAWTGFKLYARNLGIPAWNYALGAAVLCAVVMVSGYAVIRKRKDKAQEANLAG